MTEDFDFDSLVAHLSRRSELGEGLLALKKGRWQKAAEGFRVLAEAGDPDLLVFFAIMHEYGKGGPVDRGAAIRWYKRAAEKGSAFAQAKLGYFAATGLGVVRDLEEAVGWYEQAAATEPAAAYSLAWMAWAGEGMVKNPRKAFGLMEQAATMGHALAQCHLAGLIWTASGTIKDEGRAALWYLRAAKQGLAEAQAHLGVLYAKGIGVPRNDLEAYKWLALAATKAPKSRRADLAALRDDIAKRLPADRLEEGKRRVRAFVALPEEPSETGAKTKLPHR